ncbi:hypothetical protein ESA94_19440 [Lacibacter luteus]|uniref:Lipocalin-like domain-containing protein n=1 Tax=Lacibacter luteus TaxID=2508719 RepID=A0A4Q1CE53_9BACT|nr:hypothetical protein [Lacibacter luteus]RXK57701.1 hypothetical protein ESA94_19440 [Lacibacter luteus]
MKQLLCLLFFILILTSCKKKNCPAPEAPSMVGFWVGKKNTNTAASGTYPTVGFALLFRSNGTVRAVNYPDSSTGFKGEGTYQVTGNTVTATYLFAGAPFDARENITATVNSSFSFMEGNRTVGNLPGSDRGLIILSK